MSLHITYANEFTTLVMRRAQELHAEGLTEGPLDAATFGELMLYLGRKPARTLASFRVEEGALAGMTLYVGGDAP